MNKEPTLITPEVLRHVPLPVPEEGGDKEERGRVLVVGGGAAFVNRAGSVGLATSGSGDVLAGVISGLVARGV